MSRWSLSTVVLPVLGLIAGCGPSPPSPREAAMAALSPEDRKLAEAQGYCAVTDEPLGEMGPPLKLQLAEKPVWICCRGCEKKAKSNPERTSAHAEELKARVAAGTSSKGALSP